MPDSRGCLNVREAAARLGVHENTIRNWVDTGVLAAERLPGSGFRRIPLTEIERIEDGCKDPW
jgi:excisionase family DNA binding protein